MLKRLLSLVMVLGIGISTGLCGQKWIDGREYTSNDVGEYYILDQAPGTPTYGSGLLYAKLDSGKEKLYWLNSAGEETSPLFSISGLNISLLTNDSGYYKSGDNVNFGTLGAGAITGTSLKSNI